MNLNHIAIDHNHLELIYSLVICHKPKNVLELGIGSAYTTQKILNGFQYNKINTDLDCVDNFFDWNGICPEHISKLIPNIKLIISNEKDFVMNCTQKYDMIISDADHGNTDKWVDSTMNLLNDDGIVIYHDVTNLDFPNLNNIISYMQKYHHNFLLFNKSSLSNERCARGLLVAKK